MALSDAHVACQRPLSSAIGPFDAFRLRLTQSVPLIPIDAARRLAALITNGGSDARG
jgi:hypothetical protein